MQQEKKQQEKKQFWKGLLMGLLLAVIMLCLVLLGGEAFKLASGTGWTENQSVLLNKDVTDKVSLIEQTINDYYMNEINVVSMENGIYKGIADSLGDPYSTYYDAAEFDRLMESASGVFFGVGMYLNQNPESKEITVVRPIRNSPAIEEGIEAGDILVEVDHESIMGMQLEDVVTRVKGLDGTKVQLTMLRGEEVLSFEVERRKIESETVSYEMKEDQTGYIMITEFDDVTYMQFKNALDDLTEQGMESLVLDLRGNPGGNLSTVVQIADLLLPKGMIVYTEDKYGSREEYKCEGEHAFEKPLAVLVDGNSASAAEILAGAIKDYGIGTLVGTTTFGKGIVQRVIPLGDGTALKLTVSKYYTPKGQNIHGIGIAPEVEVPFDADAYREDETDNQLNKALEILKE